jgi:hypothetical protein
MEYFHLNCANKSSHERDKIENCGYDCTYAILA